MIFYNLPVAVHNYNFIFQEYLHSNFWFLPTPPFLCNLENVDNNNFLFHVSHGGWIMKHTAMLVLYQLD